MLLSATFIFKGKYELVFVLTQENAFSYRFLFKVNRKKVFLKNLPRDFQNSPPFQRAACSFVAIIGNFERLQYFNLETNFLKKKKTFFKKLECRFLVESTKVENAVFLHKTTISETNVKTNRMGSTKWNYHKERRFPSN